VFAPRLLRDGIAALAASIPIIIIPITVLSILLTAAQAFHLSPVETTSWIVSLYALPGLLSLGLVLRYRQPLLLTGNVFAIIFFASLSNQISYAELVGASILTGAIVLLVGVLGLTDHVAAWLPAPIVLGLLAGAVMPYVAGLFTALGNDPIVVGGTFLAYLLGRRFLSARIPPLLPALIVGLALVGLTEQLGPLPGQWTLPPLVITLPIFSLPAVATVVPVLVVVILVQSNLPSVIYLRNQGYEPSERTIDTISGVGTAIGSFLGPTAVSLALPLVSLAAGPEAGEFSVRHRAAYVGASSLVLIGLLAVVAADLPALISMPLLLALAGLALVPVLASALQAITRGPLLLGPLFAFAIALSRISLFGFGPFFWSLVLGLLISLLLERKQLNALRTGVSEQQVPH
jgi:benzoate membrane transport protein